MTQTETIVNIDGPSGTSTDIVRGRRTRFEVVLVDSETWAGEIYRDATCAVGSSSSPAPLWWIVVRRLLADLLLSVWSELELFDSRCIRVARRKYTSVILKEIHANADYCLDSRQVLEGSFVDIKSTGVRCLAGGSEWGHLYQPSRGQAVGKHLLKNGSYQ